MKFSRLLGNPILVMFVIVAFSFLATGCEKTVTKYDKDGKPYDAKEFDPVASLAALVLWTIGLSALAAVAAGSGSSLPNQHESMLAFAGSQDVVTDVPSGMSSSLRCIKFIDSKGNLIGKQVIDVDKLRASRSIVNISDVQISSEIDEKVLKDFIHEIAKANNITSLPDSIKAEISFTDEKDTLRIDAVSIPKGKDSEDTISELTVMSNKGIIYKATTTLPEKSDSKEYEHGQMSVTVNRLN